MVRVLPVIVGVLVLLIPVFVVVWLLNRFEGFRKLRGNRSWYKDIWKPLAFLTALSFLRAVLDYLP